MFFLAEKRIIRKACFACNTPYQIMGAICITKSCNLDADIFIFGFFAGYNEVAERLKGKNVFNNVYAVDAERIKAPGRMGAFLQMVKCRDIVNSFLPENVVYNQFYASSRAHIKNLLLHELLERNPQLDIIVYDDGLGMYSKDSHVLNSTRLRKRAESFFGWNLYRPERMCFLVNMPSLFEQPVGLQQCRVQEMPHLTWNEENQNMFLDVFNVSSEDIIRDRVIIFDSLRGFDSERDRKMVFLDSCFMIAAECFGYDNVVMKPHPRSAKATTADIKVYEKSGVPMEVLYAGMGDLNTKVLITYASSAVYTPKMLFDAEPWIINLFRIVDNHDGILSEWEDSYIKFRGIYSDSSKVMAPGSIDEFKECIKRLNRNA